jgi:hypothetical protein
MKVLPEEALVRTIAASTTKLMPDFRFAAGAEKPSVKNSYPRSYSPEPAASPRASYLKLKSAGKNKR